MLKLHFDIEIPAQPYYRHWCPRSEMYTGCDSLLTRIDEGWQIRPRVLIRRHHFGGRSTLVFHLLLQKDKSLVEMRVIDTPHLRRLILGQWLPSYRLWSKTQETTVQNKVRSAG